MMTTTPHLRSCLLLLLATMIALPALAQKAKRQQLDLEKKQLYQEISTAQKILQNTQRSKAVSMNDLMILQNQVQSREQIISNIEQEITLLDQSITDATQKIDSLDRTLVVLKQEYADMVRQAYLTESTYNRLLFLFAAKDMNDAYKRIKYMEYYRDHRKKQLTQIAQSQQLLANKLNSFKTEKNEQSKLLGDVLQERNLLAREQKVKNTMVQQLRSTEKQLKQRLNEQQTALEDLNDQIRDLIRLETRNHPIAADNTKVNRPAPATGKLSAGFVANKGKLPWPVAEGVITQRFGANHHPLLPNIVTNNNGIDIATNKGSNVMAIFDGTVSNTLYNPSFQWAVIVKHGEYYSVYAHLSAVDVAKGEHLNAQQVIGTVYTDDNDNKSTVHLEIWEGSTKLNPQRWLASTH